MSYSGSVSLRSAALAAAMALVSCSGSRGHPQVPNAKNEPPAAQTTYRPVLTVQAGVKAATPAIAFSPDGRQLLTGDALGAGLFDFGTGSLLRPLPHSGGVRAVAFSPDGMLAVTGASAGGAKLWDLRTGSEMRRLGGEGSSVSDVAFFGKWILTCCDNGMARLWDANTGAQHRQFGSADEKVRSAALSPDGQWIATGSSNGHVRLHRADTALGIVNLGEHVGWVSSVAFSPDSAWVGSAGADKIALVWEVGTGKLIRQLTGHTARINSLAFSPQRVLSTGADNSTVRLWNPNNNEELSLELGHEVTAVAFSPDGNLLLARGGKASTLWNFRQGKEFKFSPPSEHRMRPVIWSAAFSPDSRHLAAGYSEGTLWLLDTHTGALSEPFKENVAPVYSLALSPDDRLLITGSNEAATLWDLRTGAPQRRFSGKLVGPWTAFSRDGRRVVAANADKATLWDIGTGTEVRRFSSYGAVAFSPDSANLVTGLDGAAHMWNLRDGTEVTSFGKYNEELQTVAFAPDGERLLIAGFHDSDAQLLDVRTGAELKRLRCADEPVRGAAFSYANHKLALTGTRNGGVCLWDVNAEKAVWSVRHQRGVNAVAFSPDGRYALTAGSDGATRVWDVATGAQVRAFNGPSLVSGAAMSSDSRLLVTADAGGNTILWDWATGHEIARLVSFRNNGWAVVTPDGRFDASDLEDIHGFNWVMPNDPMRPLPIEVFMRDYYEPRLLARVLAGETLPPVRDLSALNRVQPEVRISTIKLDPGGTTASVTVSVESRFGTFAREKGETALESGMHDLHLFRDRQMVGYVQGTLKPPTGSKKATATFSNIKLPRVAGKDSVTFSAYAFNGDRVKSVTESSAFELPKGAQTRKGRAYIITLGVNAYSDPSWNLNYAADDARVLGNQLETRLRATNQFEQVVRVALISDKVGAERTDARKETLRAVLALLAGESVAPAIRQRIPNVDQLRETWPEDMVVLSVSTHGYADQQGEFYIFPQDIGNDRGQGRVLTKELLSHTISSENLSEWYRRVDAGELVLIIDACHSSAAVEGSGGFKPGPMGSQGLGQLAFNKGMRILAATQTSDSALESLALKHGLLTHALVEDGLTAGLADYDPKDGRIGLDEWLGYAVQRVPELHSSVRAGKVDAKGATAIRMIQQPSLFDFGKRKTSVWLASSSR